MPRTYAECRAVAIESIAYWLRDGNDVSRRVGALYARVLGFRRPWKTMSRGEWFALLHAVMAMPK